VIVRAGLRLSEIMSLKENIENNTTIWLLSTLLAGSVAGITVYKSVLEIAKPVDNQAELAQIKKENSELKEALNQKELRDPQKAKGLSKAREIPSDIQATIMKYKPPWVNLLVNLFNTEGGVEKNGFGSDNPNVHFGVDALEYRVKQATPGFIWSLNTYPAYTIVGRAYRVVDGSFVLPLDYEEDDSGHRVSFRAPECNDGDELIAIVRVKWTQSLAIEDIRNTFLSTVK
jgi:hypothetical protein